MAKRIKIDLTNEDVTDTLEGLTSNILEQFEADSVVVLVTRYDHPTKDTMEYFHFGGNYHAALGSAQKWLASRDEADSAAMANEAWSEVEDEMNAEAEDGDDE